jgi:hypothetical protein
VLRKLTFAALGVVAATALAGCGASSEIFSSESKPFSKVDFFSTKDWGAAPTAAEISLTRKVTPDDYVDGSGHCAAATQASGPGDTAVGTVAGDLGTTSASPASNAPAPALGGVGLGMTECQVVQRAGQPNDINIGTAEGNERKAVLTYTSGPWPGIYTFVGGRLKVVDQVAVPEPVKPVKKRQTKPKAAARS